MAAADEPSPHAAILESALARAVPSQHRTMVVGEALRNAGELFLPSEGAAFLKFVRGPLRQAATKVVGEQCAESLTAMLLAEMDATSRANTIPPRKHTLPTTKKPATGAQAGPPRRTAPSLDSAPASGRSRRVATRAYGDPLKTPQKPDVLLLEAYAQAECDVAELLESNGFRVMTVAEPKKLVSLCKLLPPRLVLLDEALSGAHLASICEQLGDKAPPMVLMTTGRASSAISEGWAVTTREGSALLAAVAAIVTQH